MTFEGITSCSASPDEDKYLLVGAKTAEHCHFVPLAGSAQRFPDGHTASITATKVDGSDLGDAIPISISPENGTAGNSRLPVEGEGQIDVLPTTVRDKAGEAWITLKFDRDRQYGGQAFTWTSPHKWVASRITPIEVTFADNVALRKNKGQEPVPAMAYKDTNADGYAEDAGETNDDVCYIKGKQPKLTVKFDVYPGFGAPQKVWVKGKGLGNNVNFKMSKSASGTSFSLDDLQSDDKIYSKVHICDASIDWTACISGNEPGDGEYVSVGSTSAHSQGQINLYVVFDTPQAPMATPWTEILDHACKWAVDTTKETEAVGPCTTKAYEDLGANRSYDGSQSHAKPPTFHLKSFYNDNRADCRDMEAYVYSCVRALGGKEVKTQDIVSYEKFWFNSRIRTVGGILDVYRSPNGDKPMYPAKEAKDDWTWAVGQGKWVQGCWWAYHVVLYLDGKIYDPCNKLKDTGAVPAGMSQGDYKAMLFNDNGGQGTWVWGQAIQDYDSCD